MICHPHTFSLLPHHSLSFLRFHMHLRRYRQMNYKSSLITPMTQSPAHPAHRYGSTNKAGVA